MMGATVNVVVTTVAVSVEQAKTAVRRVRDYE
jgi:hypothetical protein